MPHSPDAGQPAYPTPRRKAAVVEFMGVHEECIPALAHLLRLNGVEPTIYLNARIKQERPGFKVRFPEISHLVHFVELGGRARWRRFWRRLANDEPDLMVINSFQTESHAKSVESWGGPALGVLHNAKILNGHAAAREAVASGRIGLLTLAPHVTAHLQGLDRHGYADTATITSAFPSPPKVKPVTNDRRTVAIPGSVNFASRDYGQVLDELPGILERVGNAGMRVTVVGGGGFGPGSGQERRARLEEEVAARGLAEVFHFVGLNEHGFVPGNPYYAHLLGADFLLPVVPPDDPGFRTQKISSAFPTSVGLGVPAIFDSWTAEVYGLPGVVHEVGAVADGLDTAVSMSETELAQLRADLASHLDEVMARSAEEMGRALALRFSSGSPATERRG